MRAPSVRTRMANKVYKPTFFTSFPFIETDVYPFLSASLSSFLTSTKLIPQHQQVYQKAYQLYNPTYLPITS
jgi:hypothetical protein